MATLTSVEGSVVFIGYGEIIIYKKYLSFLNGMFLSTKVCLLKRPQTFPIMTNICPQEGRFDIQTRKPDSRLTHRIKVASFGAIGTDCLGKRTIMHTIDQAGC